MCFSLFIDALRNTKKVNTVQLRYLHYTFGRLVGWLAVWLVGSLLFLCIFHSCTFLSFSLSIFTLSIPRKRTFKIKVECGKRREREREIAIYVTHSLTVKFYGDVINLKKN